MSESVEDAAARRRAKILSRGADRMNIVLGVATPNTPKTEVIEEKIEKKEEVKVETREISKDDGLKVESNEIPTPIIVKSTPVSSSTLSPTITTPVSSIDSNKNEVPSKPKKSMLSIQLQLNHIKYIENIFHIFICVLIGTIYAFDFELLRFFTKVYTPLRLLFTIEIIFQTTFYIIINNISSQMDRVDEELDINKLMSFLKNDNGGDENTTVQSKLINSDTFAPLSGFVTKAADYLNVAFKFVNILNNIMQGFRIFIIVNVLIRAAGLLLKNLEVLVIFQPDFKLNNMSGSINF